MKKSQVSDAYSGTKSFKEDISEVNDFPTYSPSTYLDGGTIHGLFYTVIDNTFPGSAK